MQQVITVLYNKTESHDLALRLFLMAGQSADQCGFEEIAYDFFVQVSGQRKTMTGQIH
jgi:vacuolar protein sorting-associated protein 35